MQSNDKREFGRVGAVGVPLVLFCLGAFGLLLLRAGVDEEPFALAPRGGPPASAQALSHSSTTVGTGWSSSDDPRRALGEAAAMALQGKAGAPDFVILFASAGSDAKAIHAAARETFGARTQIFGGTSDSRAVVTDKGLVNVTNRGYELATGEGARGLALMTITSPEIAFGASAVDPTAYSSVREAASVAVLRAVHRAGKTLQDRPKVVLTCPTIGIEDDMLEGIQSVLGRDVIVLGGTAGGPTPAVWGGGDSYEKGFSLALLYTDLTVGWTFEGGFDVTDAHQGRVTAVDGQGIVQIDGRPALDVYDEWLGGEITRLVREVGKLDTVRDLLTLHPIYRRYRSAEGHDLFLFSHPWPKDPTLRDRTVMTSTRIREGETVFLSHGTWETLLNRIGALPKNALVRGGLNVAERPLLGIGFLCGGVMGAIPEVERRKIPILLNYSSNQAPFIANFTWGEQGLLPGIGAKHGNLTTGFLVIAAR